MEHSLLEIQRLQMLVYQKDSRIKDLEKGVAHVISWFEPISDVLGKSKAESIMLHIQIENLETLLNRGGNQQHGNPRCLNQQRKNGRYYKVTFQGRELFEVWAKGAEHALEKAKDYLRYDNPYGVDIPKIEIY